VVGQGGAMVVVVVVVVVPEPVVVEVVEVVQRSAPEGHINSTFPTGASAPPLASMAFPSTPPGVTCQVPFVHGKTCWKV
jgi:hypothetical protein